MIRFTVIKYDYADDKINFSPERVKCHDGVLYFFLHVYVIPINLHFAIVREGLTVKSERERADAPIIEDPITIVESVKHPATVRMHRVHRLRISAEGRIHRYVSDVSSSCD